MPTIARAKVNISILIIIMQTLRDLMGADEIQTLDTTLSAETEKPLTKAEIQRRKLEEDMRKEAAERKKKRDELLQKEEEYEKV